MAHQLRAAVGRRAARAILIDDRGRLVLIKRTEPGPAPYWTAPGGGVEDTDASVEAALHRKLAEELGAKATSVSQVFLFSSPSDTGVAVNHFFVARLAGMDESADSGPEFTDPSMGGYELVRIGLRGDDLASIDLKPAALKAFILANREALLVEVTPQAPPAPHLPLFVYGSLRPGELAHRQIERLVSSVQPATAPGLQVSVRDGLPFAHREAQKAVDGDLLWPSPGRFDEFYGLVREYEGTKLYSEADCPVTTADGEHHQARAFLGRRVSSGHPEPLQKPWTSAREPLFSAGLDAITHAGQHHFKEGQGRLPADHPDFWPRFLPIQGLYLVLCTVLERYTSLVYGATVEPTKRVGNLRHDADAAEAIRLAEPPPLRVFDSRDAEQHYDAPGRKSFDAWYQVRSNLTHRGKGGFHDFEIIEKAIVGLHDAMRHLLASQLPMSDASRAAFASSDRLLRPAYIATYGL